MKSKKLLICLLAALPLIAFAQYKTKRTITINGETFSVPDDATVGTAKAIVGITVPPPFTAAEIADIGKNAVGCQSGQVFSGGRCVAMSGVAIPSFIFDGDPTFGKLCGSANTQYLLGQVGTNGYVSSNNVLASASWVHTKTDNTGCALLIQSSVLLSYQVQSIWVGNSIIGYLPALARPAGPGPEGGDVGAATAQ
jgi:hypothetical protein